MIIMKLGCGCAGPCNEMPAPQDLTVDAAAGLKEGKVKMNTPGLKQHPNPNHQVSPATAPTTATQLGPADKQLMGLTGAWEVIPITVDSGAVDTVGPKAVGQAFPILPTRESSLGLGYRAANGSPIRNFGERTIEGQTEDGQ